MNRLIDLQFETSDQLEINLSPLIDMVFLLLIFFMVTTVFEQETGVQLDKPQATTAQALAATSLMISLDRGGNLYHAGNSVHLNEVRGLVRRHRATRHNCPVVIVADQAAATGVLVEVIDECKLGGATTVSVAATI